MKLPQTAADLQADVRAWLAENPHAPARWRGIAERLVDNRGMAHAWRELAKHGRPGRRFMAMAIHAADFARQEAGRTLTSSEEAERLRAVEDAARKLREAIDAAPGLDRADLIENHGRTVALAWRPRGVKAAEGIGMPVPVVDLCDLVAYVEHAAATMQGKPRLVKRQRHDPGMAAFVRFVALVIQQELGTRMLGTIARIASAALDRQVAKEQVNSILR